VAAIEVAQEEHKMTSGGASVALSNAVLVAKKTLHRQRQGGTPISHGGPVTGQTFDKLHSQDQKNRSMMPDEEEYEAELQARTPEKWASMAEKARADEKDVLALQHLMWRRDVKDWEHLTKLAVKPDIALDDRDYVLRQVGEIADRLRSARDNPKQRERRRWQDLVFCAAMIGASKEALAQMWLQNALDSFSARRMPEPGDDAPLLAHATYAVESLLDALLMDPKTRAELEGKMRSYFLQTMGDAGVRAGSFNAVGQLEMLGEVVRFPEPSSSD
jgi:hypothetical protein